MKTKIVIAVYNQRVWTRLCLEHIDKNTNKDDYYLLVVDNNGVGSTKGILNEYKDKGIIDKIITNDINLGAYMAWNQGIIDDEFDGEYVCIIHNDVLVSKNWLPNMINDFSKLPQEISVVIPTTSDSNEHTFHSSEDMNGRARSLKFCHKDSYSYEQVVEMLDLLYENNFDLFAQKVKEKNDGQIQLVSEISSFCMLIKSNIFDNMGLFDTDFYPYCYGDKFWHYKLNKHGYEACMSKSTYVHHNNNTTSDGPGFNYPSMAENNKNLYESKMVQYERDNNAKIIDIIKAQSPDIEITHRRKINKNKIKKANDILFIRHDGIGDIIMSAYVTDGLKKIRPNMNISYLTSKRLKMIPDIIKSIDSVLTNNDGVTADNHKALIIDHYNRYDDYDCVIDWTMYPETHNDSHLTSRIDILCELLGLPQLIPSAPALKMDNKLYINAKQTVGDWNEGEYIIMPVSATCEARTVDKNKLIELCQSLINIEPNVKILLVGDTLNGGFEMGRNVLNACGKTDVQELLALVSMSGLVITTDTSLVHISALFDKKCVALFGSWPPELRLNYYNQDNFKIIYDKSLSCSPCYDVGCADRACLNNFDSNEVAKMALAFVNS